MSDVDQVRTAADIVKIVGDYVKLRKAGANYVGLCPFHSEKTPSFAVHPVKQIFHCFGCGVGGDVFKFVMLIETLSFPEALSRVAEKVGVRLEERAGGDTYDANTKVRAQLLKLHEVAGKFYASQLGGTAEGRVARAYLADRGMSDEVVGRFRIGYAPGDGQALMRHLTGAGFETDLLEKSGLVLTDTDRQRRYDRFRRRVIFPIANESGKVAAFAGRSLGDEMPKYLNSPETPIYTKSRVLYNLDRSGAAVRKQDYAILVEGYMDCITVMASGIENVVASCGTSLTEAQIRLLGRYTRRVIVNYDPDTAGQAATERSLNLLLEAGFEAKVLALPGDPAVSAGDAPSEGKLDPDAFIKKRGVDAYRRALATAPTYLDYLTERAAATHDLRTPEGKVAAVNVILPFLAKVPNPLMRSELAGRLAERLHVEGTLLRRELGRAAGSGRTEVRVPVEVTSTQANHAVKQLLRMCLENSDIADAILPQIVEEEAAKGLAGEAVFKRFWEVRKQGMSLDVTAMETDISDEDRKLLHEALFWPGDAPTLDVALGALRSLQSEKLERKLRALQSEIEAATKQGDLARIRQLSSDKLMVRKELNSVSRVQKNSPADRPI